MTDKTKDKTTVVDTPINQAKSNVKFIVLYALALAAALGFNDLIGTIINRLNWSNGNIIISKVIYVCFMFSAVLLFAYFTHSTVPI